MLSFLDDSGLELPTTQCWHSQSSYSPVPEGMNAPYIRQTGREIHLPQGFTNVKQISSLYILIFKQTVTKWKSKTMFNSFKKIFYSLENEC